MAVKQLEVKAKENSFVGGIALDTGITVAKGDRLIIRVAEDDIWSSGAGDRISNANGMVAGNKHGGVYGTWTSPAGHTFPYGSLVGSLDGGKTFFLAGTRFDAPAPHAGTLSLYYWDHISSDNSGFVTVSVDTVPAAVTIDVKAKENSFVGGIALETGITVAKGDRLIVKVAEDDIWSSGAGDRISNANGMVAGNKHGGVYGTWTSPAGHTFPYGSLVGSLDGGKTFFLVGTQFDAPAPQEGKLSLYYWDHINTDNSGFVTVTISGYKDHDSAYRDK